MISDLDRLEVRNDIAAVIVTGDFTTGGDWRDKTRQQVLDEFVALRVALGLKPEQIIAIPGNHDIVRYPENAQISVEALLVENQTTYQHEHDYRLFVDDLVGRSWRNSLNYVQKIKLKNVDLLVCVLNSCTILATRWTEYGFVGNSGLDAIERLQHEHSDRPTYKFMALHHHLLPVADVEAPNSKGVTYRWTHRFFWTPPSELVCNSHSTAISICLESRDIRQSR